MKQILVFKTSADTTMYKLLEEIKGEQIDCLMQSSQVSRYKKKYLNINFIDIQSEGFYNLSEKVLQEIGNVKYDEIYITLSGTIGYNYENVIEILQHLYFRKAFFYNCNGRRTSIPVPNAMKDLLCKWFVWLISKVY